MLLGDGSFICKQCTYHCAACGNMIEDLAIITGDQAFCAACFKCRDCKQKLENLKYAQTAQGIFCIPCHESLMARRRKKTRVKAKASSGQPPVALDNPTSALPPSAALSGPAGDALGEPKLSHDDLYGEPGWLEFQLCLILSISVIVLGMFNNHVYSSACFESCLT